MATHQKKHNQNRGIAQLIFKEKNEQYAEVIKPIGDSRFEVQLQTGDKVIAKLTGRLIKGPNKQRVMPSDFVLIDKNCDNTESDKYYIIHKYSPEDKKKLIKNGELVQIKTEQIDTGTLVIMDNDVAEKELNEIDIDDNFIDNI